MLTRFLGIIGVAIRGERWGVGLQMRCSNRECGCATGSEVGFEGFRDAGVGLLDVIFELS
jgi:hypothetical protein